MSVSLWSRVTPQQTSAIREGLRMVRKIISTDTQFTSGAGLTTSDIYKLALKEAPSSGFQRFEVYGGKDGVGYMKSGSRKILPPLPPHPEHPIRSMSFLKNQVLPILEGNKEIRLATTTRIPVLPESTDGTKQQQQAKGKGKNNSKKAANSPILSPPSPITVRLWKPVQKPKNPPKPVPQTKGLKPRGHEVGVGEDWGHLNRRRKRARLEKVMRDVRAVNVIKRAEKRAAYIRKVEERKRMEGETSTPLNA